MIPFRDPDHALRWALLTLSRPVVKTSSLGTWRGAERVPGELTVQERHGLAVQIVALLERLEEIEHTFFLAKHLPLRAPAPDRSGKVFRALVSTGGARPRRGEMNLDKRRAQETVAAWLAARMGSDCTRGPYRLLVASYLSDGTRAVDKKFQKAVKRRRQTAEAMRRDAILELQRLDDSATSHMRYWLRTWGFLG